MPPPSVPKTKTSFLATFARKTPKQLQYDEPSQLKDSLVPGCSAGPSSIFERLVSQSVTLPTSYKGLGTLQDEFLQYQLAAWGQRPSNFFALELCGEAGELANLEKKAWKGRTVADEAYIDEAADVVIAILNYANSKGIDLAQAVADKMAKIEQSRMQANA